MGLKFIQETDSDCLLGVWEINEDFDQLREKVSLSPDEEVRLESFRNEARKLEFLSVRVLLQQMAGREARIVYDRTNKPYLENNLYNISISHSGKLTSVLLSREKKVGIDLEQMTHRISRISHYFINPAEKITEDETKKRYHLYIHWCAKEALYKICDKNALNFRTHMVIEPFEPAVEGKIRGHVDSGTMQSTYDLQYRRMKDYVMVWCCM